MKNFKKVSIVMLAVAFVFSFAGLNFAHAATNPNLGAASTFSVLASTLITGTPTSISGDVGNVNAIGGTSITGVTGAVVTGTIYAQDLVAPSEAVIAAAVQANASTAYSTTAGLAPEGTVIGVSQLGGITRGAGVYDIPGNALLTSGVLTLDGPGTYIFRTGPANNLTSSAGGSINFINGARACDLFWNIGTAAEIGGTSFAGTILASTGIHFTNSNVALNGRALAVGADVTLGVDGSISGPTCPAPSSRRSDSYTPPVPPLIDVVKVPSPLALPDGPGLVSYTYTLRNIGTVPVTNITMVGDTCSPIVLTSGDTNTDSKLDVAETWVYNCSTTLTKTHTNIVTTTGWANGISTTDIASATVVVGAPIVPPLIHVTKIPNPLVLLTGSGMVTYTEKITNPGIVTLSNIRLTDDKCAPMKYISGDTNNNSKLETTETWTYTCQTRLMKTTTNTATASGDANGLTAKDFAIATVVVSAVPGLPKTGFGPENNISWNIIIPAGILGILISFYLARKKQTN